jgi:hypothetical protein
MFGRRYDGVKIKNLSVIEKAGPFFMPGRVECSQLITQTVRCEPIDNFIKKQRALGKDYTYTDIIAASIVRLFYLRPKMNRFIIHNEIYEHKDITLCMVVKKKLSDEGEELTLKFHFDGTETIDEVKKVMDETIKKNLTTGDDDYKTTKAAGFLGKLPAWLFRTALWFIRFFDRHDCFTKLISDASCFHCSVFVTNLKSIKLDAIYHHLYDFGTCSSFVAMGKIKIAPYVRDNTEVVAEKVFDLGINLDERIADGFYFSKTLRLWNDIFTNPECLLEKQISKTTLKKSKKKKKEKKIKEKKQKNKKIKEEEK